MSTLLILVFLSFCHIVSASHGFDFGDALALMIGMAVGIVGICACLGCYARRRAGGLDAM
ncbi:hypothetical protein L9F63_020320 [Diploptera punctata]|uniref:Transmembrane protein n=1 Tax=Diploptera punctata TaxID=6984 RepID=A0AAD7ZST2_DIPPU|nr:hypothetical protein L9F63_020320 [Diploptera punctata]